MPDTTDPIQLAIQAVESAQNELATAKKELKSHRKDHKGHKNTDATAEDLLSDLMECMTARENETAAHNTALEAAKAEADAAKSEAKAAKADAQQARSERDEIKGILDSGASGPVHIYDLIWGNKHYGNEKAVHDDVVNLIRTGSSFWVTNDLFRHDPLPGVNKVMTVVYRYTGSGQDGRIKTFVGLEQGQFNF